MFAIKLIRRRRTSRRGLCIAFPAPLKLSVLNINRLVLRHHPSHSSCHLDSGDSAVDADLHFSRAALSSFRCRACSICILWCTASYVRRCRGSTSQPTAPRCFRSPEHSGRITMNVPVAVAKEGISIANRQIGAPTNYPTYQIIHQGGFRLGF